MTKKVTEKNRRTNMARVLIQSAQKSKHNEALSKQYETIRKDVVKLRGDVADGYELVKQSLQTFISRRTRAEQNK